MVAIRLLELFSGRVMAYPRRRISKSIIDGLSPGEILWDSAVKGFGVRCQKSSKVYLLKTRIKGRQRWFSIGRHGSPWTPDKARIQALQLLGQIAEGKDPALTRTVQANLPTVAELCDRYLKDYAEDHKKPSSTKTDRANIANHVKPLIGKLHVSDVTLADVDKFKRDVKDGKSARQRKKDQQGGPSVTGGIYASNRCIALLSKMFNLAERWGWRDPGSNPSRNIERYKENQLERFLSEDELVRLSDALIQSEKEGADSPYAIAAIRLLIFTGARRGEILTLEWDHVDFERATIKLPDSKTGKKEIFLSAPALETLSILPRQLNNQYVICGVKSGRHLVNLQKPWVRIRKLANLNDVRLHDLRHSFASVAASSGMSLPMIGKLLGHTQAATTQRYAHLADNPIRAANEKIGQRIASAMSGKNTEPKSLPFRPS